MHQKALLSLSILYFMLGFITCLNDILVPYLKVIFKLDYAQAALVQFSFFGAYGLTSAVASRFIERIGYQRAIIWGFVCSSMGCLLFYPAVSFNTYGLFLGALFVLAIGIVLLQVSANPFVTVLGPAKGAPSRLTMVQAFNSFGTFLAPFFGAFFILSKLAETKNAPTGLRFPYLIIAAVLLIIAILISRQIFPPVEDEHHSDYGTWKEAFNSPALLGGMLGIFAYVGAEVAIGSFLVNYVMERSKMPQTEAASLVALYWGGAMVGRFLGIFTLREFTPSRMLTFHALLAVSFILISINSFGFTAIYSMVLVGICNSIMFPVIFSLSVTRVSPHLAQKASGLLGTSIIGGAVIPLITGQMADVYGLRTAFLLPAVCYLYIAAFGVKLTNGKDILENRPLKDF